MEPSEAQYLIINALDTLDLLGSNFYDEDTSMMKIQVIGIYGLPALFYQIPLCGKVVI